LDELLTTLVGGDHTTLVLLLDLLGFLLVTLENLGLLRRRDNVVDRDRDTGPGGPVESGRLEGVQRLRDGDLRVTLCQIVDDLPELLLGHLVVDEAVVRRHGVVEERPAEGGLDEELLARLPT